MRIKHFNFGEVGIIEKEINEWLKENEGIEVVYVTQSESDADRGAWGLSIIIWYETTDKSPNLNLRARQGSQVD